MPDKPLSFCRHVGCDQLVAGGGYCPEHKPEYEARRKERWAAQDRRRGSSIARGYDMRWRKYIPSNPAQRVKPPKIERTEAKYLDEKQTAQLLELLQQESMQHRTMIQLFLLSGLRRGELCGLEWGDIDFGRQLLTVRRASQYLPGKGIFTKETKTATSDRTIKLPKQAFEILREYKRWQNEERLKMGDRWESSNRIFAQYDGKPVHPDSISGWFRDFIAKTDLPKVSIHSLRHTNITLLIAAGVPLRTVSYRAGHAQTSTTANIYSHAIRTADEMAAEVLEDMLIIQVK